MNKFSLSIILCFSIILLSSGSYKESPTEIAKQLYFPVTGNKSNIGSYWGDDRDGGARKHEGIDIFAAKGTALVAIADGYIQVFRYDELGGNNITLQPDDYNWNAYYAHLDKVYVKQGQVVKKGQLIGTVGNTGNAKTTPSHLHFGIYTSGGAIDPLPYVKTSPKISTPVPADKDVVVKKSPAPVHTQPGKSSGNKTADAVGNTIKTVAIEVVKSEILRRIRIRL